VITYLSGMDLASSLAAARDRTHRRACVRPTWLGDSADARDAKSRILRTFSVVLLRLVGSAESGSTLAAGGSNLRRSHASRSTPTSDVIPQPTAATFVAQDLVESARESSAATLRALLA
jgi:hypothetical protein